MSSSSFFAYPTGESETGPEPPDLGLWAQRSQHDWHKLLQVTQTLRFRPNETALKSSQSIDGIYIVGFGRFYADDSLIPEGNAIGIASFFDQRPLLHTITCQTDGELLHLSKTAFATFAARHPELGRDLLMEFGRILASQLRSQQ